MYRAKEILKIIEDHKGRKLDLNNNRDRMTFFSSIQRDIDKKVAIINNIKNCLSGQSTFDKSIYKVIRDSRKN
jgi:hypothetical protein